MSDWLVEINQKHIVTREPGGTLIADQIRSIFMKDHNKEPMHKETELCLVSAARSQHTQEKIKPALQSGSWVLCDRYADSSRVYQKSLGGLDSSVCESVIKLTTHGIEPDITILLDCEPKLAMQRIAVRDETQNRYDNASLDIHDRIRTAFLELAQDNKDRFVIIDASSKPEKILELAKSAIESRMNS